MEYLEESSVSKLGYLETGMLKKNNKRIIIFFLCC